MWGRWLLEGPPWCGGHVFGIQVIGRQHMSSGANVLILEDAVILGEALVWKCLTHSELQESSNKILAEKLSSLLFYQRYLHKLYL